MVVVVGGGGGGGAGGGGGNCFTEYKRKKEEEAAMSRWVLFCLFFLKLWSADTVIVTYPEQLTKQKNGCHRYPS